MQDYDYTPNPELKGWTNDHPFPPEIEVESPYLKRRQSNCASRFASFASRAAPDGRGTQGAATRSSPGSRKCADFVETAPSGWTTPTAVVDTPEVAPAAARRQRAPARPAKSRHEASRRRYLDVPARSPASWAGPIRLELLPHPAHGGKITRGGAESAIVRLSATLRSPTRRTASSLTFFQAEADFKEPRYFNGNEISGVLDGWQTSKNRKNDTSKRPSGASRRPSNCADDELKIVVQTDRAGCVRLSRFRRSGFDPLNRSGLDDADRQALAGKPDQRTIPQAREARGALSARHGPSSRSDLEQASSRSA